MVVCPDCGTPHHRGCYLEAGQCANHAKHGEQESWSPEGEQAKQEQRYDAAAHHRCSKCGTVNPPEGIFCQICGCRLGSGEGAHSGTVAPDCNPISLNPFTTPYGGISPDEELDGVSVRDIALFVGESSHYYIPKFKVYATGGKIHDWNWPAFLFRGLYFLYRKLYLAGIILIVLSMALSLPLAVINYFLISDVTPMGIQAVTVQPALYNRILLLSNFASFGCSIFCAMWFNRMYYRHVLRSIKKLRTAFSGDAYDQTYITTLSKKGRTNRTLILIYLILVLVGSMLSSLILIMFSA